MSEIPKGLAVVITSLAMRFYAAEGWTAELIKPYLTRGRLIEMKSGHEWDRYFILEVNATLDVDRMFDDGLIRVVTGKDRWSETRNMSDRDAMKRRNW